MVCMISERRGGAEQCWLFHATLYYRPANIDWCAIQIVVQKPDDFSRIEVMHLYDFINSTFPREVKLIFESSKVFGIPCSTYSWKLLTGVTMTKAWQGTSAQSSFSSIIWRQRVHWSIARLEKRWIFGWGAGCNTQAGSGYPQALRLPKTGGLFLLSDQDCPSQTGFKNTMEGSPGYIYISFSNTRHKILDLPRNTQAPLLSWKGEEEIAGRCGDGRAQGIKILSRRRTWVPSMWKCWLGGKPCPAVPHICDTRMGKP